MTAPTPDVSVLIAWHAGLAEDDRFDESVRSIHRMTADALTALAAERDRADRWAAQVAAIEKVLDDHAFDDEDGNGFVPIGPLQDALNWKKATA